MYSSSFSPDLIRICATVFIFSIRVLDGKWDKHEQMYIPLVCQKVIHREIYRVGPFLFAI